MKGRISSCLVQMSAWKALLVQHRRQCSVALLQYVNPCAAVSFRQVSSSSLPERYAPRKSRKGVAEREAGKEFGETRSQPYDLELRKLRADRSFRESGKGKGKVGRSIRSNYGREPGAGGREVLVEVFKRTNERQSKWQRLPGDESHSEGLLDPYAGSGTFDFAQTKHTVKGVENHDRESGYIGNLEHWVGREENQLIAFAERSSFSQGCAFLHTEPSCLPVAEASESVDSIIVEEYDGHVDEDGEQESKTLRAAQSIRASRAAEDELLPRVMIVGRPNVGKSALFNRLIRRREALVYNTPDCHVTRDVREGIAKLVGLRFKILDTAGLETFTEDQSILSRTAGITATALQKCQIALFLVDGRAGLQPQDADVGKWLRKTAPHVRVVIALNKAEGIHNDPTGRLVAALGETYQLGFGEPTPISAESGEGLGDLYESLRPLLEEAQYELHKSLPDVLETKAAEEDTDAKGMPMQLAIAGRPNVGKSTLVNALLREERVLTGPEPGLTRDSVTSQFEYDGRKVRLVDTAGWMQRVQVKEGPAALSAMHARKGVMMAHVVALVLDGEEIANTRSSMRHAEAALARWVVQEGRGLVVVVNKMDLLAGKENAKLRGDVMRAVPAEIQTILPQVSGVPVVFLSALERKGSAAIMRNAFQCYEKWSTRLTTAQLNRWLRKVMSRHPKNTSGAGYGAKVKFMTQVKARPPTFVVFVSGTGELEETDLRFLASALREDFGLDGIPLRILQRSTKKK